MEHIEMHGRKYLLWLVENILDAVGNPLPGQQLVCLARPNTTLFESLIALGVLDVEEVQNSYPAFIKGPNYDTWVAENTRLKPIAA